MPRAKPDFQTGKPPPSKTEKTPLFRHAPTTMSKLTPPSPTVPTRQWYHDYRQNPTPRWWIRTQNAFIWWVAFVTTYAVARFPLGIAIGIIRNARGSWTIASQVWIADAIVFWPFRVLLSLLARLDHHQTLLAWLLGIYFGGFFLTWSFLLTKWFFTSVHDYLRTTLDNR